MGVVLDRVLDRVLVLYLRCGGFGFLVGFLFCMGGAVGWNLGRVLGRVLDRVLVLYWKCRGLGSW